MKYYVVLKWRQPGIFMNRDECKRQVEGFFGAIYKSFTTEQAAQFAWKEQSFWHKWQSTADYLRQVMDDEFEKAICTDAACPSNPWPIEYRGVDIATGVELFHEGPYPWGSVNIAEFLAIVEGIQEMLNTKSWIMHWKNILYSDSKIAISWVMKGRINTQITRNEQNNILFEKITQAEQWLKKNKQRSTIITLKKWLTSQWGQIPADFGRK